jgi:hypothetical protein
MTVEQFLNKRFYHNKKGWINFELDRYIYDIVLERFSKYCFATKEAQKQMFHNLVNNYGCTSLFQCFYIDKRGFSNSLSGEAFDYCIRRFNK